MTFGDVTIEQYGYASIQILQDMIKTGDITQDAHADYLSYSQSVFRLAANNVWHSVLLYDMEYRDRQVQENFRSGSFLPNLREFNLIQKPDSVTAKAMTEIRDTSSGARPGYSAEKGKGPLLPDGRTIRRRFNTGECARMDCRMSHHCALCYSNNHNAKQHSGFNVSPGGRPNGQSRNARDRDRQTRQKDNLQQAV
ncbi:hypothetical protein KP79_PYT17067 [Mizuhopecten yessoensis]|uniref:C3H1-type domain-containing protein n=1 Tax=Mizuhopecten yessoensis TaxID=6573 RepID=A0A210R2B8_MIZYE|nr:hypothetical protein KP79_PYT17067 [Mizuhopecten yessoensis]